MKAALIVPYRFVPPANGGHKAAFGFGEFLAREIPFICISTADNPEEGAPFTLLPLLPARIWKYISPIAAWRCYRAMRREDVTTCITHQPFIALLLLPVCWWLSIPLHIYVQNIEYQRFRSMGRWWWPLVFAIEWIILRQAAHLYFISPDDLEPGRQAFGLPAEKCSIVPFGTYHHQPPIHAAEARRSIRERHGYREEEYLIIFFGPQSYPPNLEAVELILQQLDPLMAEKAGFPYRFLICGGGLPARYHQLEDYPRVDYLGFVEDIEAYVLASDVMINPVNTGGGVKTKLVEAIGLGKTVVSSYTGALGVVPEACGDKLIRIEDEDYDGYCQALIRQQAAPPSLTPASFYETYYWGKAIRPVVEKLVEIEKV